MNKMKLFKTRKAVFNVYTLIYLVLMGLLLLSVGSWVATSFFDMPELKLTNIWMFLIAALSAFGAFGLAYRLQFGLTKKDARSLVLIVGLTALAIYGLYVYVPHLLENTTYFAMVP